MLSVLAIDRDGTEYLHEIRVAGTTIGDVYREAYLDDYTATGFGGSTSFTLEVEIKKDRGPPAPA